MFKRGVCVLAVAAIGVAARGGSAQSLASRVSAVGSGTVELHYAARAGACGDGRYMLSLGRSMMIGDGNGARSVCLPGPARVRLEVSGGSVRELRTYVGPLPSSAARVTDLGAVRAADAAAYFLELARSGERRVGDRAIVAAVLADSAIVWRSLLAIARDTDARSRHSRNSAAFWLSRFAAAKLAGHPEDLAFDEDDEGSDSDSRGAAVFALSQLRNHEGIDPLIQVARTNRDARVRGKALFWLGQSGDQRALDLFEEILK
jgi:hypothetical protein